MSGASKKYYEANREAICAKMRERNAERRRALKQEAFATPAGIEEWRAENRERYYRSVEAKNTRDLNNWLNDPDICDAFKQFIRVCVWGQKHTLTPAFVRALGGLGIANAFRATPEMPDLRVDGESDGASEGQAEAQDNSEAEA